MAPPTAGLVAPRAARASADDLRVLLAAGGPARAAHLARRMGLHLTTVLYHLRRLAKRGVVVQRGGEWGLAERPPHERPARRMGPSMARLLGLLREHGELDHRSIAAHLGVSRPAVTALVARLAEQGLVQVRPVERRKLVSLAAP